MAQRINKVSFLLLCVLFFNGICNAASASAINWQSWSNKPFAQAKATHRYVLVFVKADWCHWCRLTKDVTLSDKNVIRIINSNYIPVRIDRDAETDLVKALGAVGLPTFIIMDSNKNVIRQFSGYMSPAEMLSQLK